MKTAHELLKDIKDGNPFYYSATLTPKRIFTIEFKDDKRLVLSANNLKSKEVLTDNAALNIINNVINELPY